MPEPVRRIEVFTGAGRRRSWSASEKAAIVAESYGAGETVCAVARRYGLTPQQLFAWRRLARQSALAAPPMFVPAVVETTAPEPATRIVHLESLKASAWITPMEEGKVIARPLAAAIPY
jgi:transposase